MKMSGVEEARLSMESRGALAAVPLRPVFFEAVMGAAAVVVVAVVRGLVAPSTLGSAVPVRQAW
jgi:hypothetical protein